MPDPISAAAVPGATSVFSSVFQSFKDPRSPYLLTGVLCVTCLVYIVQLPNASESFWLIFFPIAGIFSFLCTLCFFVKAYGAPHNVRKAKDDIEEQFKFSRAFCLAAGIFSIAYLFASVIDPPDPDAPSLLQRALGTQPEFQQPAPKGQLFWFVYDICLIHISIFVFYIMLRSIQEDHVINTPLFQITLFTSAALIGLVVITANIRDQDRWLYSCKNNLLSQQGGVKKYSKPFYSCEKDFVDLKVQRAKKNDETLNNAILLTETIISPPKVAYWYLLFHLVLFEAYWLYRLVRIGRFKLDFTFRPEAVRENGSAQITRKKSTKSQTKTGPHKGQAQNGEPKAE